MSLNKGIEDDFHIFLAEDNYADRLFFKQLLAKAKLPHKLTIAVDGENALELLHELLQTKRAPDVLILDVKLPKLSGFETLRRIKQTAGLQDIPVVVMTGSDDPDDLAKAKELHAQYIQKPPDLPRLFAALGVPLDASKFEITTSGQYHRLESAAELTVEVNALRLLLVEDNPHDAKLTTTLLQNTAKGKYSIKVAENLADAITKLSEEEIDIIALDLQLPDSFGLQTFNDLQRIVPTVPIVVVTGSSEPGIGMDAVTAGAQDYVVKGSPNFAETFDRSLQFAVQRKKGESLSRRLDRMEANEHFIALLAHELKTPIIGATNVLEFLAEQKFGELNQEQLQIIDQVIQSQRKTLSMIGDILEVFRFERDVDYLNYVPTNLIEIATEVTSEMVAEAGLRTNIIELDVPAELPEIQANAKSIRRVVHNLLDNAIKHGPSDSVITVKLQALNNGVKLTVNDKGAGIGQDELERIFKRIWQGAGNHHYTPGAGQGLYFSKQVIDAHDGTITCTTGDGNGTTFTVTLPFQRVPNSLRHHAPLGN